MYQEMYRLKDNEINCVKSMFDGIEDSMVIACFQGYMGDVYAVDKNSPEVALLISGEYSFFGGNPKSEQSIPLIRGLFDVNLSSETICIFSDDEPGWEFALMSVKSNNPEVVPRFGIVQKDYEFDTDMLREITEKVPAGFDLVAFDGAIYDQAMSEAWSSEFCETFHNKADYLERGFGYAVTTNGVLVSGASSMTVYDGGIEVQIATHPDYKRRGLAMITAAALILECVRRGLRPCWDAANEVSKAMALKLGYEYRGEYTTIRMVRP